MKTAFIRRALTLLIVLLMLASACFVSCGDGDDKEYKGFDFMKEDLSKYVDLPAEKFFGQTVTIDKPAEVNEAAIDAYARQFLAANGITVYKTDKTVAKDDIVALFYRVTEKKDNGEVKDILSNFGGTAVDYDPNNNTLNFGDEFNAALVGIEKDHSMTVHTSGTVTDKHTTLYVTYSGTYAVTTEGSTAQNKPFLQESVERWDLAELTESGKFGDGFVEQLIGKKIGSTSKSIKTHYDANGDGVTEDVILTVTIVRAAEENPVSFEITYPADAKNEKLKGKTVTFDVCVNGVAGTFDELVTKEALEKIGYKPSEDSEHKDDAVADFRAVITEYLEENYENTLRTNALNALWEAFYEKLEVTKYPEVLVDDYYNSLIDESEYYWEQYKTSSSKDPEIKTLNDYIVYRYGLEKGTKYETFFRDQAEDLAKYDLVFYTIVRHGDLKVTDAEYKAERSTYLGNMIYSYQYSYYQSTGQWVEITEDDYLEMYGKKYVESTIRQTMLTEKFRDYLYDNLTIKYKDDADAETNEGTEDATESATGSATESVVESPSEAATN